VQVAVGQRSHAGHRLTSCWNWPFIDWPAVGCWYNWSPNESPLPVSVSSINSKQWRSMIKHSGNGVTYQGPRGRGQIYRLCNEQFSGVGILPKASQTILLTQQLHLYILAYYSFYLFICIRPQGPITSTTQTHTRTHNTVKSKITLI